MPGESCDFIHAWVFPDINLILRIAVGANDLVDALTEHQIAHLGAHIHSLESGAS